MMRKRTYGKSRTRSKSVRAYKKAKIIPKVGLKTAIGRARYTKAKLTYCEQFALNPGLATAAVQVFAANGLYDPDISGIGHQPAGFDQYMTLYGEYIVTKSWIKVTGYSTDSAVATIMGVTFLDKAATSADSRKYIEQGNTNYTVLGQINTGAATKTVTHEVNLRTISTQDIFNDDNFSGTASINPPDTHYWHVFVQAIENSDVAPVRLLVEIQYEVYFRDPAFTDLS